MCSYQAMKDSMQGWSGCPPTSRLRMTLQQRGIKDPLALDLIEKLLALNPAHRISASTAALDIWFNSEPAMMDLGKMPKYEPSHEMTMKNKRAADKARRQEAAHGGDGRGQHPPGALPHQMAQHGGMGGHYPMRPPGGYVGGAVPVTAYQHGGQPYMGPGDRRPPGGPPLPSWQQERR